MDRYIAFITAHPLLIGIFVVLLILFLLNESRRGGKTIVTAELIRLLNKENAVVLDLRDAKAFRAGHITGAVNLPHTKLKERVDELNKYKERPLVLVCAQGHHCGAAGQTLARAGFDKVVRLKGGIQGWTGDKLPLVK